jgi:phage terminase large subunit-like protein
VLHAAEITLPVRLVHASRGKAARAEPVAALYEAGRVLHAGQFPMLEDEMCGILAAGGYQGPGRSPDRADALVWALTELMLGRHGTARVRVV